MTAACKLIVIAYDVRSDRRRRRLFAALRRFGDPVQYSVFECFITRAQLADLKRSVDGILLPPEDSVRYYEACDCCCRRVITMGPGSVSFPAVSYVF